MKKGAYLCANPMAIMVNFQILVSKIWFDNHQVDEFYFKKTLKKKEYILL